MKATYTITLADKTRISADAEIDTVLGPARLRFDSPLNEFLEHELLLLPLLELRLQSAADRFGGKLTRRFDGPIPQGHETGQKAQGLPAIAPALLPRLNGAV